MTVEHDFEFEPWPAEVDPIRLAALPLLEHILAVTLGRFGRAQPGDGRGARGYRADPRCVAPAAIELKGTPMPHSYKWADAEHTVVQRDDGRSFVWPKGANVANINGRIAEEYRVEGSPKPAPYKTPEPVAKPKQTKPPAISTVESAEQVLADLDARRRDLAAARAADDAERSKVAFRAHALHELEASRSLREIADRARGHDERLRELDCAIAEAGVHLAAAKAAEVRKANQQRAEELRKHVDELSQIPLISRST